MAKLKRVFRVVLGIIGGLVVLFVLCEFALWRFGLYMSEGDLHGTITPGVTVALSDSKEAVSVLVTECGELNHSKVYERLSSQGLLFEVPDGTRMRVSNDARWDRPTNKMTTIRDGKFRGRTVFACTDNISFFHAWP